MYATKLKDKKSPAMIAGIPEFLIILIVFFLYVKTKKIINAIIKKKDLIVSIFQVSVVSKDLMIKPPQLKKNPPSKQSIYPGIL